MLKVLIIEDEILAAEKLINQIKGLRNNYSFIQLDSILDSINWLKNNSAPDLIFMDIHLSDGSCFKIFEKVKVTSPIVFITAFDQYAINAFKVNSIGYLLKPVTKKQINDVLEKFEQFWKTAFVQPDYTNLLQLIKSQQKEYKTRFLVKLGLKLIAININEIICFYADSKSTFLFTEDKRTFIIDYTLDDLEDLLNRKLFYRLNRKYLASIKSIKEIQSYPKGRLKVFIKQLSEEEIIISNERANEFKKWLNY
jgi:DNA-binding LytR/AlgR family response regulator